MKGLLRLEQQLVVSSSFVARELAPARLRSSRRSEEHGLSERTRAQVFRAASQPSASKLARHSSLCFSDRKMNPERIHPMVTAHEHIAAMHQCNRLDDGQPKAMIVAAVAARGIDPVEAFEQPWQVFAGNR
ncbi:hypothetical protein D3C81_1102710 [compost metagenome]